MLTLTPDEGCKMVNQVYVGIDTSKDFFDSSAIDIRGSELMETTRYNQDITGFQEFYEKVKEICNVTKSSLLIGIESTGIYHVPLYDFLVRRGCQVRVFNGLEIRGLRKTRIRKTKTDKIDAKLIANALRYCYEPDKKCPLPIELRNLREFCRIRYRLKVKRIRIKVQLVRDLDLIFPGFSNLFREKLSNRLATLLKHACTPKEIQKMSIEELQKYVPKTKAIQIKELADKSKGATNLDRAIKFEIKSLIREGKLIENEMQKVENKIERELNKTIHPVRTIIGIGPVTSAIIITELGDINKFNSPKKVVAFAGIDPVIKESGKSRYGFRISKRGSKRLREALFQAAFTGSTLNPVIREYYKRKRSEGKTHKNATICCARKLCHIIYAVWKNNKPFYIPPNISSEN